MAFPAWSHSIVTVLAVVLSAWACSENESPALRRDASIELRVMTFNIEWGGTNVSFEKVVEAIRLADADIVGIQEAEGNLQRLAADLGWQYNLLNYAISKYPMIEPPGADGRYVLVEVEPGKVVALANVHLPSDPYGPDEVRDGAAADDVLELERRVRLPKMKPYLTTLKPLIEHDVPVFVTGDFNAPAHTDWTAETVGTRPFLRYAVNWPVSRAISDAGFHDSWREVYPDPVADPGLTWWAARPPLELYSPGDNDAQDRIDFVWYAGPVTVRSSEIVGEKGRPDVSIRVTLWPSDHRGVVSTFRTVPAPMPELVSTGRRIYRSGQDIDVFCHREQNAPPIVKIIRIDDAGGVIAEQRASGDGHLVFSSDLFTPGHYAVTMGLPRSARALQKDFWILAEDVGPAVEVFGTSFESGEPIEVAWSNAPGNRNDYIAAYKPGVPSGYDDGLAWTYVHAMPEGRMPLDGQSSEWGWPLEPGNYVIRLMKDDGYEQLAESDVFTIE
jgi:endonuclease/exonuclease/phosphatase family metal-dependent hydrolase